MKLTITPKQQIELVEHYAETITDAMDICDLWSAAYEVVLERLKKMPNRELLSEIERYEPELLGNFKKTLDIGEVD